jgi:hypothetical protein
MTTLLSTDVRQCTTTCDTPIDLAHDERIEGYAPDGRPLVRTASGRAGLTFGVTYLCDPAPYDDREAFDPRFDG